MGQVKIKLNKVTIYLKYLFLILNVSVKMYKSLALKNRNNHLLDKYQIYSLWHN